MHIRRFTRQDLPQATTLFIAANQTDTLNWYMSDMSLAASHRTRCARYLRDLLSAPGNQCFVMAADSNDSSSATYLDTNPAVAWAIFSRRGTSEVARKWQCSNPESSRLERVRAWAESKYTAWLPWVDPVVHRAHIARIQHILAEPWDNNVLGEAWVVDALYVDPKWQRKGISRTMLEWVKQRAREEGVPVVVKGSPISGLAYRGSGFRSIGFDRFGEFFDEVALGGERHQLWIWEPEGREGEWFDRARDWWKGVVGEQVAGSGVQWRGEEAGKFAIGRDDPLRDDVGKMLVEHVKEQHGNVPPGFGFAMDAQKLAAPDISFYTMRDDDKLVGMCALKDLGDEAGEVKSLRTVAEYRGQGLGVKMLNHIINEAKSRNWKKIYLETGKISFYDTAAKLYRRVGFDACGPFADYSESDHNQFFCLDLESQKIR